jgi:hypothetical protein
LTHAAKAAATLPLEDVESRATAHTSSVVDFGRLSEIRDELNKFESYDSKGYRRNQPLTLTEFMVFFSIQDVIHS